MKMLKEYEISFFGLKEGLHRFEYEVDKEFFEFFKYDEFREAKLFIDLEFRK